MTGGAAAPPPIREYEVRARSTDIFGRVLCSARDHHFIVDGPVQNGCPGEELTPPEVFLSAIAACGVELLHVIAKEQARALGGVRAKIYGRVDRSKQPKKDVTLFNEVRIEFELSGTDAASAEELVDSFTRR
ncbi:MAG TPA: OsmC family protein [Gemmatimonadaceae bacterium]|nr:OsmC family protein [Gemmatimonadaceae bacterium]